jgi:hypothetical protein
MPENYEEFALKRYEEREKEIIRSVEDVRKLLANFIQSLRSEPSGCEEANGRNPTWQVLKVALLFPILGRVLPRDLSPLKPVLVEGVWDRVRSRLVPLSAVGTVPIRDF